jgi:hypothetical protein
VLLAKPPHAERDEARGRVVIAALPGDAGAGKRPSRHRLALSQPNLSLTELSDDLLRSELLSSWHLLPSLGYRHQRFSF